MGAVPAGFNILDLIEQIMWMSKAFIRSVEAMSLLEILQQTRIASM